MTAAQLTDLISGVLQDGLAASDRYSMGVSFIAIPHRQAAMAMVIWMATKPDKADVKPNWSVGTLTVVGTGSATVGGQEVTLHGDGTWQIYNDTGEYCRTITMYNVPGVGNYKTPAAIKL